MFLKILLRGESNNNFNDFRVKFNLYEKIEHYAQPAAVIHIRRMDYLLTCFAINH